MSVIVKNGNLLDATEKYIGHQVNCRGVMGAGVAKAIKEKYRDVYESYRCLCQKRDISTPLLGSAQFIFTENEKVIFNLFGQDDIGGRIRRTNYAALINAVNQALEKISITNVANKEKESLALPYGIGCGLGGGDWEIVYLLLLDASNMYNVDIILYKLKK